ncbi:hypothetical protein [Gordonia insulae]|uniref:Transmembrane protein n=1 Tax=Gordonia insulae TaxID=2420509 RepID=A0A3G8JJC2_9ACTN|nr:hypothetical protein [Gordonia insulae]AZG45181.1 hypothetical protein D7316_01775 [Gordonia insulae]
MTEPDKPQTNGDELRQAVVHGAVTIGFGIAILLVALASSGAIRTTLIVVAPVVVLIGALAALWRTYRNWRAGGRWQVWQGASWFLLAIFIVFLFGTGPTLVT